MKGTLAIGGVGAVLTGITVETVLARVLPAEPGGRLELAGLVVTLATFLGTVATVLFQFGRRYQAWTSSNQAVAASLATVAENLKSIDERVTHIDRVLLAAGITDTDGHVKEEE